MRREWVGTTKIIWRGYIQINGNKMYFQSFHNSRRMSNLTFVRNSYCEFWKKLQIMEPLLLDLEPKLLDFNILNLGFSDPQNGPYSDGLSELVHNISYSNSSENCRCCDWSSSGDSWRFYGYYPGHDCHFSSCSCEFLATRLLCCGI